MIQRRICALLLAVLFALPMVTASAQTPVPAQPSLTDITESPGLINAVWRFYGGPNTFISGQESSAMATPSAAFDPNQPVVGSVDVFVYEFDSAENAANGYPLLLYSFLQSSVWIDGPDSVMFTYESATLEGADVASVARQHFDTDGGTYAQEIVLFQRDQYVVMISSTATTFDESSNVTAWEAEFPNMDIAAGIALNGQPAADEAMFHEDGTSTGGLWGFMPGVDSGVMQELQMRPLQDVVVFPFSNP